MMSEYTDVELKAMAFETTHQINLLRQKQGEIVAELIRRKAIAETVEVTPDVI